MEIWDFNGVNGGNSSVGKTSLSSSGSVLGHVWDPIVEGPSLGVFCYLEKWEMIAKHWMAHIHMHMLETFKLSNGSHFKKNLGWHHCCWEHLVLISWDCSKLQVKLTPPLHPTLYHTGAEKQRQTTPRETEGSHWRKDMIYIYICTYIYIYYIYIF